MKYVFIAQHKKTWPVDLMCRLLGVTRSGFYGYLQRGGGSIDYYHQELLEAVRDIAKATEDSYGTRRMKAALNALSYPVSRNKARKLMKEAKVQIKHGKRYKVTTNSNHKQPVFENVLNWQFDVDQPDQVPGIARKHVLFAPSWGPKVSIESGVAERIIDKLIENICKVTLRPHPQTIKFAQNMIDRILAKHKHEPLFSYEKNVAEHDSGLMISDWSSTALDYSLGLNKPVLIVDVPRKVNNPNYEEFVIEPFEAKIRTQIGEILPLNSSVIELSLLDRTQSRKTGSSVYNIGGSARVGSSYIRRILDAKL